MANENMRGLFITCLEKGMTAAKEIDRAADRAMAYAELAKALAMTGMVRENVGPVDNIEPKIAAGKEAIKSAVEKATKETAPEPAPAPEQTPAVPEEVSYDWTEEIQAAKAEQLDVVTQFIEVFGEEFLLKAAKKVDGSVESMDDIRPANVDAISEYLKKEGELIGLLEGCDEDDIKNLVSQFSDGVLKAFEDIGPANIEPFTLYIKTLQAQAGK